MRAARLARGIARRVRGRVAYVPYLAVCVRPWLTARRGMSALNVLDEEALRKARRSETVFVFGSGASLNELTPAEWAHIAEHDVFGFNWFVRQHFVRCDFHLIRQIADSNDPRIWEPQIREYFGLIDSNPEFADTTFLVQHELRARGANLAFEMGVVPPGRRYFPWHTSRGDTLSRGFATGLSHARSTLSDTINAAYLMGWKSIVLVGVDLYDRRYFWLPEGETREIDLTRDASYADAHTQSSSGLIDHLAGWAAQLHGDGVTLSVYNPKSLLVGAVPIYEPPT